MAKKSFKDIIFKLLRKDEDFQVKFAQGPGQKISIAHYKDKQDADKFAKDILTKGGKAIVTKVKDRLLSNANEDAPANATGTAVAGTGDDSSTVVVKKKKELQKKLMTRMGITETIDRTIPDLEYPKDEIRERADQLKELALQSEQFKVRFTDPANKKKFHIIYRSKGEAEAKMAQLKKDGVKQIEIVSEDLDAQPQDRDVKKIKGTQPKKYYKKMSKDDKEKRAKHFTTRDTSKNDNRPAPGDKDAKTKPSIHTKKFKQMYGEDLLDEKIKGIENKAKKSGMPYGILKKVYDRGMAAWRGGHRPGATQQQWAFARVNSFVTKSSGTWGGADKDLAKKVRGSK